MWVWILICIFSEDRGHRLENLVFVELYRLGHEIYYYNNNGHECDFVVCDNQKPELLIQVCEEVVTDNQDREYGGLVAAMKELQVDKGVILTMNQSDMACVDGYSIETIPVWKWISMM